MRIRLNHKHGNVLVSTLIITGLVTIVVAALLAVVRQQNYYTSRSTTWCAEIPLAEAGIEEAMAHLNSQRAILATNGWTASGSNVVKSRYFTNGSATIADGYFYTSISTASPPVPSVSASSMLAHSGMWNRWDTSRARSPSGN